MRLHQARMRGHDAHAEAVGAAFSRGNAALVNVCAVSIGLAALIQHGGGRIADVAVVYFAVIGFHAHMLRIDPAQMHARTDLQ